MKRRRRTREDRKERSSSKESEDKVWSIGRIVRACVYSRIERGVMIYDSRLGKSDGDEKRRRATE